MIWQQIWRTRIEEKKNVECIARVDDNPQTKLVWCMELLSESTPIIKSKGAMDGDSTPVPLIPSKSEESG